MEIPAKYNPEDVEQKWYDYWEKNKMFRSVPDGREPYTVVIPPPNVTGVLHMGHMLNNTIQDILVRRARMQGKNALWVPGTDHASIATEAKVVKKLRDAGVKKSDLDRDKFIEHAWDWTHKHGGIILKQLRRLGASCDWERTAFTMDEARYESVIDVFIDLYNKGLIYRGLRMINWDPVAQTAVSDEEVFYREVNSQLYYVRYKVVGEDNYVTIATTRPETILGDTAVCVNPEDGRYQGLKGKKVIIPLVNREVPVIFDEYVDMEFGTGCLKVTPAHDENDYQLGQKHKLETIDILNNDGTISKAAQVLVGKDRFEAKREIVPLLDEADHLVKVEDYTNKVGYSERTDAVIEPRLSKQWFMAMKKVAKPALEAVMYDEVKLQPPKFKNMYRHWMENVRDWCISRQLWWGHRIPVYYIRGTDDYVVAKSEDQALRWAREKTGNPALKMDALHQDEDVMDTWFSSWLWPISVFDGIRKPDNKEIEYYYPTNDLVTAPEILFFWVARMIIAGYEYRGDKPFRNVYLTGIVRDEQGRKMSKQLGNSPDPIRLMEQYGADGVRVGILFSSPAGNDLLFNEKLTEQGRNFANKIWNAFRLTHTWTVDNNAPQPEYARLASQWMRHRLDKAIAGLNGQFDKFRISDALMNVYRLFWDDFASWYLEISKPPYGKPVDGKTYADVHAFFTALLKILHPFMPFITEEIWQLMEARAEGKSLMLEQQPTAGSYDETLLGAFEQVKAITAEIRTIRKEKNIPQKEPLPLQVKAQAYDNKWDAVIGKLNNLQEVARVDEKPQGGASFIVKGREYFVPLEGFVDKEAERKRLQDELNYAGGFLKSINKKLENPRFVDNAPEAVVAKERQKKADTEQKIKALNQQLGAL